MMVDTDKLTERRFRRCGCALRVGNVMTTTTCH